MDMAGLLSFAVHEDLVEWLFREFRREVGEDEVPVSWNQLARVDSEIFAYMIEANVGGIQETGGDDFPLDKILKKTMEEPRIKSILVPRMKTADQGGQKRSFEQMQNNHPNGSFRGKDASKGKGKGKFNRGKGKDRKSGGVMLPRELIGMEPRPNGVSPCFAYNLPGGCSTKGPKCNKGEHVCMYPKCGSRSHPCTQCPLRNQSASSGGY